MEQTEKKKIVDMIHKLQRYISDVFTFKVFHNGKLIERLEILDGSNLIEVWYVGCLISGRFDILDLHDCFLSKIQIFKLVKVKL